MTPFIFMTPPLWRHRWLWCALLSLGFIGLFTLFDLPLKLFAMALLPAVAVLVAMAYGLREGGVAFGVLCAGLLLTALELRELGAVGAEAARDTLAVRLAPIFGLLAAVVPVVYAGRIRRRLEHLLAESRDKEALLGEVINALPAQVAIFDRSERYLLVNQRWADEVDATPAEVVGRPRTEAAGVAAGLEPGQVAERQQGEHTYQLSDFPVRDARGDTFARGVIAFDITERKVQERQLRETEARNRALIDALPDALIRYDRTGRHREIIPPQTFTLSQPTSALLQSSIDQIVDTATAQRLRKALAETLASGDPQTLEYEIEIDAVSHYREMRMTRLGDDEVLALVRDVTARKQTELALLTANRHKDEFLATMSHELRTPLNSVLGFAEMLEEGYVGALSEQQQSYVHDIRTAGTHLLSLINNILDVVMIDAGRLELSYTTIDLPSLVDDTLSVVQESAQRRNLTLVRDLSNDLPPLYADARKLKQMLHNYLSNALKFTSAGGTVTVSVRDQDDAINFEVSDTGVGIAPEDQADLFKAFAQLDSSLSRKHEGAGLGLLLVKRLAGHHGGSVWLRSVPDEGSTFGFAIPKTDPKTDSKAKGSRDGRADREASA